jgi:hypothetical protein
MRVEGNQTHLSLKPYKILKIWFNRDDMNSLQHLQNTIKGNPVDRIPNFDFFMIRKTHHTGMPLSNYYFDHRILCEANLAVVNDFDLDIVQTITDPYREAADSGLEMEFPADNLLFRKKPLIAEPDDL